MLFRLPIELSFTASLPQEFNFNLECRVKQKPSPLHLNVKASGYAIQMSLLYTSPDGRETALPVQPPASKEISFGQVRKEASSLMVWQAGDYLHKEILSIELDPLMCKVWSCILLDAINEIMLALV